MDDKTKTPHSVLITDRNQGVIAGVKEVLSYSDELLSLDTTEGKMLVLGKNLKIVKFSTQERNLSFIGFVNQIKYSMPSVPLLKRIFK